MSSGYGDARPVIGSDSLSQTLVAYKFKDILLFADRLSPLLHLLHYLRRRKKKHEESVS